MNPEKHLKPMTEDILSKMSPKDAFTRLVEGNDRFLSKVKGNLPDPEGVRNYRNFIDTTSGEGQFPFAAILSCMDSRMPTETLFDQFIGDVFNIRIAGNFVNQDILGGMEFACTSGVKLILVLGHDQCGAIVGAARSVHPLCFKQNYVLESDEDNLTPMLENLIPAVKSTSFNLPEGVSCQDEEWQSRFIDRVAKTNVDLTINNIRLRSKVIRELHDQGKIDIQGATYNISDGKVTFFSHDRANIMDA